MTDLLARRRAVLGSAYRLFYDDPVEIVRGDGAWLWDASGRRYLDAYNNVAVVGHANPRVVSATAAQATLLNTHTRYLHPLIVEYAERLTALMPDQLDTVMLTCTGSEANDLALRLATSHTGSQGVVVTRTAYHGVTSAVAAVSPSLGVDGVGAHVRLVDPPHSSEGPAATERFAGDVRAACADLASTGHGVAAMLVDSVLSSDGLIPGPMGFLAAAAHEIRSAGGLFIADEVQAGFGRTGHWWGLERHGVEPDIVTLGKPMGNGHPVAGVVLRREVEQPLASATRYFNTFGGNPVSCAAGLAVLDEIEDRGLIEHAGRMGSLLDVRLREALGDGRGQVASGGEAPSDGAVGATEPSREVVEIRSAGLFAAVEVTSRELAAAVVDECRRRGVLIAATGPGGRVLKLRPPLVIDADQVDLLVATLADSLHALTPRDSR